MYQSIDWHDFVTVQFIDFTDTDQNLALPPPTSIAELESIPLAQRQQLFATLNPTEQEEDEEEEVCSLFHLLKFSYVAYLDGHE